MAERVREKGWIWDRYWQADRIEAPAGAAEVRRKQRAAQLDQATLLKRSFDFDVFTCRGCGGRRRGLAVLKVWPCARRSRACARAGMRCWSALQLLEAPVKPAAVAGPETRPAQRQ